MNKLSNAENERLALLLEECGEVQQIIGKILRHGYESFSPFDEYKTTNRKLLAKELSHVRVAVNLLLDKGDLFETTVEIFAEEKSEQVNKYLHYNKTTKEQKKTTNDK